MAEKIGIPVMVEQAANLDKINSTLADTDLVIALAANQSFIGRLFLPISLAGTASGAKAQITVPAGGVTYQVAYQITNGNSATVVASDIIVASAAFSNALANATQHCMVADISIVNGSTAGNITVQFAQLVTDASAATLLAGAYLEGKKY